jgi:hypothetical protein
MRLLSLLAQPGPFNGSLRMLRAGDDTDSEEWS